MATSPFGFRRTLAGNLRGIRPACSISVDDRGTVLASSKGIVPSDGEMPTVKPSTVPLLWCE